MSHRIADLAAALGAPFEGDGELRVTGAAEPASAGPHDLALAMSPRYSQALSQGGALAAVLWPGADWRGLGLRAAILPGRPRLAMAGLTRAFDAGPGLAPGVHPSAIIHPEAQIAPDACIGPFCVIGAGARIGARARIAEHVSIGAGAVLGEDALVLAGARISARVTIGARFIAQPGCVIGGDGFSFVTETTSRAEMARAALGDPDTMAATATQPWLRIHSLGAVTVGDDVEIGANSSVDRGTIRDTRIGRGTKLDSLVQVGHNAVIGEDCLLCGQVGIAGSTRIGNRVVLGGQAGVVDNLVVGDDVVIAAGTLVLSNVPEGRVMMGSPAVRMAQHVEIYKAQRKLPRVLAQLADLQKTVAKLLEKGADDVSR